MELVIDIGGLGIDLAKAAVMSLLAGAAVLAVHTTAAVYHDGLRTSVPELWTGGRDRRALAAYSYSLSIGFLVAYALPYSLATGIIIIHLILLTADMVGLRVLSRPVAIAVGLAYGLALTVAVDVVVFFVQLGASYGPSVATLFLPLAYTFPLLAPVAIASQHGLRWGVTAAASTIVIWRMADLALQGGGLLGPLTPTGGAVALAITSGVFVLSAARGLSSPVADITVYEPGIRRIRAHWPLLVGPPVLIALAASMGWLAGEPVQLVMLAVGSPEAAAAVAFFSAIGFMPMVAMSGLLSGVWNQDGYCDWYLGAGYLASRNPILGALGGLLLVAIEIGSLRRFGHFLNTHPGIHGAASAMRDALDSVPALSILAGAVWASIGLAGPVGAMAVLGAHAFNEAKGRPVMPLAMPVFAFLGVAVVVQVVAPLMVA